MHGQVLQGSIVAAAGSLKAAWGIVLPGPGNDSKATIPGFEARKAALTSVAGSNFDLGARLWCIGQAKAFLRELQGRKSSTVK